MNRILTNQPFTFICEKVATSSNQKRRERGARGGGRPSNVLQDNFSDSSISGVKIAGGGHGRSWQL